MIQIPPYQETEALEAQMKCHRRLRKSYEDALKRSSMEDGNIAEEKCRTAKASS